MEQRAGCAMKGTNARFVIGAFHSDDAIIQLDGNLR
jgi:hypothetical protein